MVNFKFDIQLFGTDEETDTPTEEVVNEEEEEETNEEVEFSDSEQKDSKEEKDNAKRKAQNDANAKRRIEQKQREQERERERIKNEGYVEGIKKATKGINPYTNAEIKDKYDVEIYEIMKKLEDEGKDPYESLPTILAEQRREQERKNLEAQAEKDKQFKDIQELENKYGREVVEKLANDPDFDEFSDGLVGVVPMTTIYEKYIKQQANTQAKAKDLALEKDARRASSTGSSSSQESKDFDFTSMTPEEFHKWSLEIAKRR